MTVKQEFLNWKDGIYPYVKEYNLEEKIYLSEFFGPTIQGEGANSGVRSWFLRVAQCNLHCSFCDSAYSWRFNDSFPHKDNIVYSKSEQVKEITLYELLKIVVKADPVNLVITGGEPMLYQVQLVNLLKAFRFVTTENLSIEVETAGTLSPSYGWRSFGGLKFNISPKLASSGNLRSKAIKPDVLKLFLEEPYPTRFKFVVCNPSDLLEITDLVEEIGIPKDQVWLMPEGATLNDQLRSMTNVAQLAIDTGFNFSPRIHTLIWGNKRGV